MASTIPSDIPAFHLHDNIDFVGSSRVSVHVLRTEEGLVVIDTGYPDMLDQIVASMNALGLDPRDICAIIHSHGHIDHFGCTARLKQMSGATTYISRADNDIANGTLDLSWAKELNYDRLPPFDCDVLLSDGDVLTFGSTSVRFVSAPGHTMGTMAMFVTTPDGTVAAMHGGVGLNSMTREFLNAYGLSLDCREQFRQGLHRLMDEKVDLVLGNHPQQNDTAGKRARLASGEKNVLDATEWQRFLAATEHQLDNMLVKEQTNA